MAVFACAGKEEPTDDSKIAATGDPTSSATGAGNVAMSTPPSSTPTLSTSNSAPPLPSESSSPLTTTAMPPPVPSASEGPVTPEPTTSSAPPASSSAEVPNPATGGAGGDGPTGEAGAPQTPSSGGTNGGGDEPDAGGVGEPTAGGAGGGGSTIPSGEFTLTVGELSGHDNDDCAQESCGPCDQFPPENIGACMGGDESPLISWTPGPEGTVTYAVALLDMSISMNHWVIWNIPATVTSLPAALAGGALSGDLEGATQQSFSGSVYVGAGACEHVYEFRVYAVPETLTETARAAVLTALDSEAIPQSFVRVRSKCTEGCTNPFPGTDCTE